MTFKFLFSKRFHSSILGLKGINFNVIDVEFLEINTGVLGCFFKN